MAAQVRQQTLSISIYVRNNSGVKVVVPSNPYDAKGLLMSAIQDDNLVVFEDKTLLGQK